jgi:cell filamentation protein
MPSRGPYQAGSDPYVYPGTDVLRNKFDIRDPVELSQIEGSITALSIAALSESNLPGAYDLPHLQAFHLEIFSDVYPWAGEIRTVFISRGAVVMFAAPENITSYLSDQLHRLADENYLRDLDRDAFVDRLTHYLGEVNAVHPFREGNGRTQRAFFSQLARDAGFEIAWDRLDAQRNIDASAASFAGNSTPLRQLLAELIAPLDTNTLPTASDLKRLDCIGMRPYKTRPGAAVANCALIKSASQP